MVLNNSCAMKKIVSIFAFAAVAAATLVSCSKEIDNPEVIDKAVKMKTVTVKTSIETKTTLDTAHENIVWSAGDKISIFNDANNSNLEAAYAEGADITIEVPETTTEIYAHYPYFSGNSNGPKSVSVYISNNQTQTNPGQLNGYFFPMVAKGTVSSENKALISLYPVAGALALNLYHTKLTGEESVKSVKVTPASENTNFIGQQITDLTGDNIVYSQASISDPVTVTLTNALALGDTKPANKQTFAGQIYVCLAKQSYSGVTFEIETDKGTYTITSNNTAFDLENNDFVPVNINLAKASFVAIPVIDNTTTDYSTGFEGEGFTAGTTYNNTSEKVDGPDGAKWASYYGTVSTNNALTDNNSMQLRWYTSAIANLGYARTDFILTKVGYVTFNAVATNGLKLGLYYKCAADWTLAKTFELTASSASYSCAFETVLNNAQLKFQIILPETAPSNTSNVRIDDVVVKAVAPAPDPTTIELSKGATSANPIEVEVGKTVDLASFVSTNNTDGAKTFTTSVASSIATLSGSVVTGVAVADEPFVVSLSIASSSGYAATTEPTSIYVKVVAAETLSNKVFTASDYDTEDALTITKSPITAVFAKGGGTTNPNVNATRVRLYQNGTTHKGGTLTISSTSNNIKKVEIDFDGNQNYLTSDAGSYSDGTWSTTTAVSSVVFYCNGSSNSQRADITGFTVYYEPSGEAEPEQLVMSDITCSDSGVNENSLTFTWANVAGAEGYQVSTDGSTFGSTQTALSYTLSGLEPATSYTIWVKAIGDGTNYTDSEAKESASGSTKSNGGGDIPDPETVTIDSEDANGNDFSISYGGTGTASAWVSNQRRLYVTNSMIISSTQYNIKKIEIVYGVNANKSGKKPTGISVDSGTLTTGYNSDGGTLIWEKTSSTNSIEFTVSGSAGNVYVESVKVTFE